MHTSYAHLKVLYSKIHILCKGTSLFLADHINCQRPHQLDTGTSQHEECSEVTCPSSGINIKDHKMEVGPQWTWNSPALGRENTSAHLVRDNSTELFPEGQQR